MFAPRNEQPLSLHFCVGQKLVFSVLQFLLLSSIVQSYMQDI